MVRYLAWTGYGGQARVWLAAGLLAAALGFAAAGIRLPLPVRLPPPGPRTRSVLAAAWVGSLLALLLCSGIYFAHLIDEMRAAGLAVAKPEETILPVTLSADAVLFTVLVVRGSPDPRRRVADALIAAMAAPMIFELPFDPLVIVRPTLASLPGLAEYRVVVYVPLLLTEVTTLLLLRFVPGVHLERATFFAFALMLGVWAVWAWSGFDYPSTASSIAPNLVSKVLAFVTALTLFLRRRPPAEAEGA